MKKDCFDKEIINSMNWLFNAGDVFQDTINNKNRDIVITNKKIVLADRMSNGKPAIEKRKLYGYHCNICTDDDWIHESALKNGCGCKACAGKKVVYGINDVYTLRPDLIEYFDNPENAKLHTLGSNRKEAMHCIYCNEKKIRQVSTLVQHGFGNCACSTSLSYPEKFFGEFLKQLNVDFIRQLSCTTFEWCGQFLYDFYLKDYNYIVETHGLQHYNERGFGKYIESARTLEEEQENDRIKQELAMNNNVGYMVINCKESNMNWIKASIMNSELPKLLKFSEQDIDWLQCNKVGLKKSIVEDVCEYWMSHKDTYISTQDLARIFDREAGTINKYLKQGVEMCICDYDPYKAFMDSKIQPRIDMNLVRKISEYWEKHYDEGISTKTLESIFNMNRDVICKYLKLGAEHRWCDYDPYKELAKTARKNGMSSSKPVNVYTEDTYELLYTFSSAQEAARKMAEIYGGTFQSSKISAVCRRERKHHRHFIFRYDENDEFKTN